MTTYNTVEGDVWDLISFKQYGDEAFINILINANPHLRHIEVFDGDIQITIPDKPEIPYDSPQKLPPWK
jgi:phage tail protein X